MIGSANEQRRAHRLHGVAYTVGILVSFWSIVAVLLIVRAAGHQAGWGFQLQSPTFVVLMASLLFFMALSLAGQFDLGLSLTGSGDALTRKAGYTGSFFTGVLATVVATPCTAPLMGAIGYALAQPAFRTFLIFTAVALGLALPYLLFTLNPGWARHLPRPGQWMENWQPFSAAAIQQAQAAGRPVFVDYTAAWRLSCQLNERTVLHDAAVERQLGTHHYVLLRADWTRYDPAITQQLAQVSRSGVPTYVIYPPQPDARPQVLPELLTRAAVLDAIKALHS